MPKSLYGIASTVITVEENYSPHCYVATYAGSTLPAYYRLTSRK